MIEKTVLTFETEREKEKEKVRAIETGTEVGTEVEREIECVSIQAKRTCTRIKKTREQTKVWSRHAHLLFDLMKGIWHESVCQNQFKVRTFCERNSFYNFLFFILFFANQETLCVFFRNKLEIESKRVFSVCQIPNYADFSKRVVAIRIVVPFSRTHAHNTALFSASSRFV